MAKGIRKFNDKLYKGQRFLKKQEMRSTPISDARLLGREFYNANEFPVTFTRMVQFDQYTLASGKPIGMYKKEVPPGEWYFMPTYFYEASWPAGRHHSEVIAHWNVGLSMHKGIKPDLDTIIKARRATR